jgi:hypothetical protein
VDPRPGLLLLPSDPGFDVDKVAENCWRPDVSRIAELFPDAVVARRRLDADESATAVREVWDHFENEGECLRPGSYRFRSPYTIARQPDGGGREFDWGFAVVVESP